MTLDYVPLSEILLRSRDEIFLDSDQLYRQVTVKLHHKGAIIRRDCKGLAIKTKKQYRIKAGQFLLSRIDARNGAIALVPSDLDNAIVSNEFWIYNIDNSKVSSKYLLYYTWTRQFLNECIASSTGTTNRVRLQEELFLKQKVPAPTLEKQLIIVDMIDKILSRINRSKELRAQSNKESLAIFTIAAEKVFEKLNARETTINEIENLVTSGATPRKSQFKYVDRGILFIRSQNVRRNILDLSDAVFITDLADNTISRSRVFSGDVLLNITGASIGRCAVVPDNFVKANVNQHVCVIRPKKEIILPKFLGYSLNTKKSFDEIINKQAGATRQGLNHESVRSLKIKLPSIDVQKRIVCYLDNLFTKVMSVSKLQNEVQHEITILPRKLVEKLMARR